MYKITMNGVEVICEEASDVRSLILGEQSFTRTGRVQTANGKPKKRRGGLSSKSARDKVAKSWIAARKLAKQKGITPAEARSIIAKQKQKAAAG